MGGGGGRMELGMGRWVSAWPNSSRRVAVGCRFPIKNIRILESKNFMLFQIENFKFQLCMNGLSGCMKNPIGMHCTF